MKLTFSAFLFLAGAASAQTPNPFLPDQVLYNYSGDANLNEQWTNWLPMTSTGEYGNDAQCAGQGIQGNPGTYAGFWVGAGLGYHTPRTLPWVCGPLDIAISATEEAFNTAGYPDHLFQGLVVIATGGLAGSQQAQISQFEACSLLGTGINANNVGQPHVVVYNAGRCVYAGGGSSPM